MPREKQLKSRSRVTTRSAVPSRKSVKPILCESIGEKDFANLMDYSTNIVGIQSQPYTFRIEADGCTYRYTPDFLVTRACGTYAYIEIKRSDALNKEDIRKKLTIAAEFFEDRGEEFYVVTELEMSANPIPLSNIQHLKRYRTRSLERMQKIRSYIPKEPMTLRDLQAQIEKEKDSEFAQIVCAELIANELVWCDLYQHLSFDSLLKPMRGNGYVFIERL
jgi:hypothetical protein